MTVQPPHARIDAPLVIRNGLRVALPDSVVELDRDADYAPEEIMTVVQVPTVRALGTLPGQRWGFKIRIVLSTTGEDYDAVADEADRVADAMLSMTEVDGVKVSSVMCDSEPVRLSPHIPSGAESLTSTYSAILWRKGRS